MKKDKPMANIYNVDPNTGGFITCIWDGTSYTIRSEESTWLQAVDAYKNKDWDTLFQCMNPAQYLAAEFAHEDVTLVNGSVFYRGEPLHNAVVDRILSFWRQGLDCQHLFVFLNNLMQNPSRSSVMELYDFLENKNIPITDDGCFLAYKSVNDDYTDKRTSSVDNSIGQVVEMERNQVDDNRHNDCSYGYHAGGLDYVFNVYRGARIVIVKINPKDVVSVPMDYNCQKLRTCRYEVVGDYEEALQKPLYSAQTHSIKSVEPNSKHVSNTRWDGTNFNATHSSSLDSNTINYAGWDQANQVLRLEFDNLSHYDYLNVPESVYEELVTADSAGRYFNQKIKNTYTSVYVG